MSGGDEQFFAWLDGELSAADAAQVEARVRADPELSRLADRHRKMSARLHSAFDSVASAPVPERLADAARGAGSAEVIDFAEARVKRSPSMGAPMQWFAIAASLAIGVATGTMLHPGSGPIASERGQLVAAASLNRALDRQLASDQNGAPVRIGITYRDQSGAICRSFTGQQMSGVACRSDGRWQVRGLIGSTQAAEGDYRMAAGIDPQIANMIAATIAGAPLDAAQEATARDRGWQ